MCRKVGIKSTEDDLGRVDDRSLRTSSVETGGNEDKVTPLKIGFDRGGGRVIDVSPAEIDCFMLPILIKKVIGKAVTEFVCVCVCVYVRVFACLCAPY